MAKLGGRDYPGDLQPTEAETWMNALVNEFGGEVESKEAFAQSVGHTSTSSGSFRRKIADARKYGLMTPRGKFEATDLGFKLANPETPQERYEVIYEMLRNIPLLAEVHDTLNGSGTPDEFWRVLTELTDANPKKARGASEWLAMLYEELLDSEQEVNTIDEEASQSANGDGREVSGTVAKSTSEQQQVDKQLSDDSTIYVKVENDELRFEAMTDINIELAQQFLESKKGKSKDNSVQLRFS